MAEQDSRTTFATSERKHEYRTLGPNEICLLILNPGLPNEPIECSLEHCSVNQVKKYQALCCAWGDTRDLSSIEVDDCPFQVSRNLKDFLVSCRINNACPVLRINAVSQPTRYPRAKCPDSTDETRIRRCRHSACLAWAGSRCTESAIEQSEKTEATSMSILHGRVFKISSSDRGGLVYGAPAPLVHQEATVPAKRGSFVLCGPHIILFNEVLVMNNVVREFHGLLSTFIPAIL